MSFGLPQTLGKSGVVKGPAVLEQSGGQDLVHQLPPGLIEDGGGQQGVFVHLAFELGQDIAGAAQTAQLGKGHVLGVAGLVGPLHHVIGGAGGSIAVVVMEADREGRADFGFDGAVQRLIRHPGVAQLRPFHQGRVIGLEHPVSGLAGGGGKGDGGSGLGPLHSLAVDEDGLHGAAFPLTALPDLHPVAPGQGQGQPQGDAALLHLADAAQEETAVVGPLVAHKRRARIAPPVAAATVPVEDLHQLADLIFVRRDFPALLQIAEKAAVDTADGGHVLGLFHAAFDLPGSEAQLV